MFLFVDLSWYLLVIWLDCLIVRLFHNWRVPVGRHPVMHMVLVLFGRPADRTGVLHTDTLALVGSELASLGVRRRSSQVEV